MSHIVGEKQVGIKDAIKIISLLNAFQKLFVSEVLKLIFTVTATKAVTGKSCSKLRRVESYLWSFMTEERLRSCLVLATYKEKVDKIKLVEVAN